MKKCLLATIVLFVWTGAATAQPPREPAPAREGQPNADFKAEVNFVEVAAVVTDEGGAFVKDLTRDAFEIYEEGRLQEAVTFSVIDVPIERPLTPAGATEPVEWDVRAATGTFDGRVYVLVLDDLHTAVTRSHPVREAARGFVERYLGRNDLAAVVHASGRQEAGQELTGSHRLLLAAIDRFQGLKLPSAGVKRLGVYLRERVRDEMPADRSVEELEIAKSVRDPSAAERVQNARRMLSSVRNTATWLADIQGRRKALLLFSEGLDYDIYEPFNRNIGGSIVADAQQAVAAAQRANVTVYGIDPRGLGQLGELIDINAWSDYPQLDYGTFRGHLGELLLAQESLMSLSDQTGGFAIVNAGDVSGGIGRVVLDSSRYYLLGYYSDSTNWSGRFLKIDVRVKRPGLQVRARQGLLPPDRAQQTASRSVAGVDAATSPALAAALSKPVPTTGGLPLRAFAASYRSGDGKAAVLVAFEIDGAGLEFEPQEDRLGTTLDVSIVATDERARVQDGDRQTVTMRLLPETHARVTRGGVRFLSSLDLPPGRYQIRMGAHASVGDLAGMVPYDLEVPDYSRLPLALSGLVLTSSDAGSFATASPAPPFISVLGAPPVARRRFGRSEELTWFVEVYRSAVAARHEVTLTASVQALVDGRAVHSVRDRRSGEASRGTRTDSFSGTVPLKDLTPGTYLLRVEAASALGGRAEVREVPFEVT